MPNYKSSGKGAVLKIFKPRVNFGNMKVYQNSVILYHTLAASGVKRTSNPLKIKKEAIKL